MGVNNVLGRALNLSASHLKYCSRVLIASQSLPFRSERFPHSSRHDARQAILAEVYWPIFNLTCLDMSTLLRPRLLHNDSDDASAIVT